MRTILVLILTTFCFAITATKARAQLLALPGWQAQLSDNSSVGITGTVTIVDQFTLLFEDFSYDGRGGGETDIVLVPLDPRPLNASQRSNALGNFFFNDQPGSVTVFDNLRSSIDTPGLPPAGGDSAPIVNEDFTITIDRSNFGTGAAGDAAFNDFVANDGILSFSTVSVYCHPFDFDFGSGVFLPPTESNADFNSNGLVDGQDFLAWQRNFSANSFAGINALGDANFDGAVNGADLAEFESQFGTTQVVPGPLPPSFDQVFPNFPFSASSLASTNAVPEPTGFALVCLAGGILSACLRSPRGKDGPLRASAAYLAASWARGI